MACSSTKLRVPKDSHRALVFRVPFGAPVPPILVVPFCDPSDEAITVGLHLRFVMVPGRSGCSVNPTVSSHPLPFGPSCQAPSPRAKYVDLTPTDRQRTLGRDFTP